MRPRLPVSAAVVGMLITGACGSEPGTLLIAPDFVPDFINTSTVTISGLVTRTPPKNTRITILAQGGQNAVTDTANAEGQFSFSVQLRANRENTIELTASDDDGSTSVPVTLTITHDIQPPRVVSMTPTNQADGAPATGDVTMTFDEDLDATPQATIELVTIGESISGVMTLAADNRTVTFAPQSPRRPNAVYELRFTGITDVAGNPVTVNQDACFVTARQDPEFVMSDPVDAQLVGSGVSAADLVSTRLVVAQGLLLGVLQFTTPRTYDTTATNNLLAYIEFDIDQDIGTGVISQRDTIFSLFGFSEPSDTRVEYLIGIDPYSIEGPSFVGQYTAFSQFNLLEQFQPMFCGPYVGFAAQTASFGGDDGDFNFTVAAFTLGESGISLDAAPSSGHYVAAFSGSFGAQPGVARVPAIQRHGIDLRVPAWVRPRRR